MMDSWDLDSNFPFCVFLSSTSAITSKILQWDTFGARPVQQLNGVYPFRALDGKRNLKLCAFETASTLTIEVIFYCNSIHLDVSTKVRMCTFLCDFPTLLHLLPIHYVKWIAVGLKWLVNLFHIAREHKFAGQLRLLGSSSSQHIRLYELSLMWLKGTNLNLINRMTSAVWTKRSSSLLRRTKLEWGQKFGDTNFNGGLNFPWLWSDSRSWPNIGCQTLGKHLKWWSICNLSSPD